MPSLRKYLERKLYFLVKRPKHLWPALLTVRAHFILRCLILRISIAFRRRSGGLLPPGTADLLSMRLRKYIKAQLPIEPQENNCESKEALLLEIKCLKYDAKYLRPLFSALTGRRALYVGQAYYNSWYLSRALRSRKWKADLLNWDLNPLSQIYYHGQDFQFTAESDPLSDLRFYVSSIYSYDMFHFANSWGICFGFRLQAMLSTIYEEHFEIYLLKTLGKKIAYTNNGCMDGVSQTSFSKWGPESVCSICKWRNHPNVCSDDRNLLWGKFRNEVVDYQCLSGGNRVDFNFAPQVHESPEAYCLNEELWHPELEIPPQYLLPVATAKLVRLYHAVGNKSERTDENGINIKSSHVYGPLIEKLKAEGFQLETLEPTGIPNMEVRYFQAQADIFLEMLTFGWFGSNAREAMMLGKPVICYIRPSWLEDLRKEIPDYAAELPIVSATPDTVESVLRDLLLNPDKRKEIGSRSREFAVKWHSAEVSGRKFDKIYTSLLQGDPQLLSQYKEKPPNEF